MSETKFTPGPWHPIQEREHHATSGDGHYLPKWMIYDSKNAWCICSTGSTWPTEEEEDANAHLIAAAPEMYAMLERIMDYRTGGPFIANPTKTEEIYNLLAKARGEVRE